MLTTPMAIFLCLAAGDDGTNCHKPHHESDPSPAVISAGKSDPRMQDFDRMMQDFMSEHGLPGAAVAVTHDSRLVYARGFGYAVREEHLPVRPTSLFRIASLSKPITAVAVLTLVEQGKIALDDRVFDLLHVEPLLPDGAVFDDRQREITIRQLLQHRGGWDRDVSFDPMFQSVRFATVLGTPPPAEPLDIIRVMLGKPLDYDPGRRYAYSNYGYCLLGRVIETVSGKSYEDYVRQEVLKPLGIRSMRLGKTRPSDRQAPDEVQYYDAGRGTSVFAEDLNQPVPRPYGAWYLEAMDAHGGWLASVVDLARFAAALDRPDDCPLLQKETIEQMFARPPGLAGHTEDGKPKNVYYSLGWLNRSPDGDDRLNSWHTGSLSGTSAILIRRHDGRNFVALFNSRQSPHAARLSEAIDPVLHRAANQVIQWPDTNLFGEFE